ncbi:unnamed protein product, partial [Meganyctiphanes norvegica]
MSSAMQTFQTAPPAIAPAPGPQTSTTTVNSLHQPLHHHMAQTLTHPGVPQSPMPQCSQQFQVVQTGLPGGPYLQQLYPNAQGQLIMPSNLTLQPANAMNQVQTQNINGLNQPIQVITAGQPFKGQLGPHMLTATGKPGVLQGGQATGYTQAGIPTSSSQTLVLSQLPVGVISSQQHSILPAHSGAHKPGELHKQGITWAAPAGTLQSQALLNQPIFIRGTQPGQENVYMAQPQTMQVQNWMQQGPQQAKPRAGMEMQPNIQPKVPNMRPNILPSISTHQIRPGASVSTQTAAGQAQAQALQGVQPRPAGKVRGKNAGNRASQNIGQQASQMATVAASQAQSQQLQLQHAVAQVAAVPCTSVVASASGTQVTAAPGIVMSAPPVGTAMTVTTTVSPAVPSSPMTVTSGTPSMPQQSLTAAKMIAQTHMQTVSSVPQNKSGVPMTPPTAPLPPVTGPPPGLPQMVRGPKPSQVSAHIPAACMAATNVNQGTPGIVTSAILQPTTTAMCATTVAPSASALPSQQPTVTQIPTLPQLPTLATQPITTQPITTLSMTPSTIAVPTTVPVALTQINGAVSSPRVDGKSDPVGSISNPVRQVAPVAPVTAGGIATPGAVGAHVALTTTCNTPQTTTQATTINGHSTSESGEVQDGSRNMPQLGMMNGGTSRPPPPALQPPNIGIPKATVKPQVLTHVIEGFVIHEASEPFPVSRSSLISEISKTRTSPNYVNTTAMTSVSSASPQTAVTGSPSQHHVEKDNLPDDDSARNKSSEQTRISPKGDTAKCEFCGKVDLRSKFKRSKRFCSTACAKRYNVGCSKRIGLFKTDEESPSKRFREDISAEEMDSKHRVVFLCMGISGEREATPEEDVDNFSNNTNHLDSAGVQGITANATPTNGTWSDGEASADSPSKSPRVDILRWQVKDVVDFIQNLPGCKEYAEDFALQEIDGQALMLLKADHLMSAMSMKLGPALKICAKIESMRGGDRKENE